MIEYEEIEHTRTHMLSTSTLKRLNWINIGNFKKFFYFALVGGFGTILNTGILYLLSQKAGMNYLIASGIATEIAIISNFLGNNYLTFKNQNKDETLYKKFFSFQLISLVSLFGTIFFLWLFVTTFGKDLLLVWNIMAILIMFVANFILNSVFTWKAKKVVKQDSVPNFLLILISISTALVLVLASPSHALNSTEMTNYTDNTTDIVTPVNLTLEKVNETVEHVNLSFENANIENQSTDNNTTKITDNTSDNTRTIDTTDMTINQTPILANMTAILAEPLAKPNLAVDTINSTNDTTINTTTNDTVNTTISNTTINNTTNITPNITSNVSYTGGIIAVSQLGYHPSSIKEVVLYTDALDGTFSIRDSNTNVIIATYILQKPKNYAGNTVNCQGNMPCLTGDFTNFSTEGTYYIEGNGIKSYTFPINKNIFYDTIPIFFEFFNAQLQQGSSYHADMHSGYNPPLTSISDGSFIMEADQAALSLIRLGSAYRRNPRLFQFNNYDILSSDKPDIQEYIVSYVDYLKSLQGISIHESNTPGAMRLDTGMIINNIFVPGPTTLTNMNVYIPGSPPTLLQTAPVVSLCGSNDGSADWQNCINTAANIYKCQIDEPCLNMTYNDRVGMATSDVNANGYAVSKGWSYEFGCYFDVNLNEGNFNNGAINPCMIFYNSTKREYTTMTLLAFLEAWPAVNDYSQIQGQELLIRSVNTYNYIKNNYPAFTTRDSDAGFYGAALFLLYDYTNSSVYLQQAYSMRNSISTTFISDATRGNEFYWEEYIRHKESITALGLVYKLNNIDPEEFFRGKMYQDYKDAGPNSISNNGERVFQFDSSIQFQNSRYILIEGLLGVKTMELVSSPESFIPIIAQNQLSWLTGMNLVQQGAGRDSPVKTMSFIFGIGSFPEQFHSRWLVDTGYSAATAGNIIGARGTGYQFLDPATNYYIYLDGMASIIGYKLGATSNGWHNESVNDKFHVGTTFNNGKKYIPGWISGAFPAKADGDTIFNYNDDLQAWEYTETTNEMIAIAIEYYAYLDGNLNNRPRYGMNATNYSIVINQTNGTINNTINTTINNTINNTINTTTNSTANITINTTINNTTNTTQNNSVIKAKIISNSTSLTPQIINGTMTYNMREDSTATFSVMSNATNLIIWFVDGIAQNTTTSQNSVFSWNPGILWIPKPPDYSNIAITTIKAQSPNEIVSWNIRVENVINPFFSNKDDGGDIIGSADSKVRVMTNNRYASFTEVNVTILSGSVNTVYQLIKKFNSSDETEWAVYIPTLAPGNNYLTQIIGFNNITKENTTYDIGLARAHYVTIPKSSSSSTKKRSSGSSGSSYSPQSFNPELIYVIFEKDVVNADDYQTLTLDTKNFNSGVYWVAANIMTPQGTMEKLDLELIDGTRDYGTWSKTFKSSLPGEYLLYSIELSSINNKTVKEIQIEDHAFYSLDKNIKSDEELGLVYTVLSQNRVSNGDTVDLILDARDLKGISNVSAIVESTKGDNFSIGLELIKGKSAYGTWKGSFTVTEYDNTYTVRSITLSNSNNEKTYDLMDRSVYVLPNPNQPQATQNEGKNRITGSAILTGFSKEDLANTMKKPLVPTILGFSLMFIVIGSILLIKRK